MCVHGHKKDPQIGYKEDNKKVVLPAPEEDMIWLPKEIETGIGAEDLYDKIPDEDIQKHITQNPGQGQGGQGQGQGQGDGDGEGDGEGEGDGDGSGNGPHVKTIDDHSLWGQSEASEDTARQIVKEMVDHAAQKCQGHVPGHLQEILKDLEKAQVRWREILRMLTGTHIGNRRWTHSRRNRRTDKFGHKGISHHAAARVSVIVDTSGSISSKALQQFFAEIEMITTRADVCMLQWDHAFQGFTAKYRRNDWKKIEIRGRGGTDMAAPVAWLIQRQAVGDCCIMLTDGYCNWHPEQSFPMITCIIGKEGNIDPCPWGNTVWIDEHQ
jgi:predicted metal-dependent peptidase